MSEYATPDSEGDESGGDLPKNRFGCALRVAALTTSAGLAAGLLYRQPLLGAGFGLVGAGALIMSMFALSTSHEMTWRGPTRLAYERVRGHRGVVRDLHETKRFAVIGILGGLITLLVGIAILLLSAAVG